MSVDPSEYDLDELRDIAGVEGDSDGDSDGGESPAPEDDGSGEGAGDGDPGETGTGAASKDGATDAEAEVGGVDTELGDETTDEWEWVSLPDDDGETSETTDDARAASDTDPGQTTPDRESERDGRPDWAVSRATDGPVADAAAGRDAGATASPPDGRDEDRMASVPIGLDVTAGSSVGEPATLEAPTLERPEDDDDGLEAFLDDTTTPDSTTFESAMRADDDGVGIDLEAVDGERDDESRPLSEKVADVLYTDDEES